MNQQLDDSKESVKSQSLDRYLHIESTKNSLSPVRQIQNVRNSQPLLTSSILKLQNGKFTNSQTVFQEALQKKKSELNKKPQKPIPETPKKSQQLIQKQPKKFDKLEQNIKNSQIKSEEIKKKKEEQKIKEEQSKKPEVFLESDEAFLETVNRLYDFDKRRSKQLQKLVDEENNKVKQKVPGKPIINEKSCIILDRKLKKLVEEDETYKQICQYRDIDIQADLMPSLPLLKDFLQINYKNVNFNKSKQNQIEIIIDEEQQEEIELAEGVEYTDQQSHKIIQTQEYKYKVGDTIKKQPSQQQIQQVAQFQEKETPKKDKKVNNQRQKRQEIMINQEQRVKTECEYYVPIHIRQQQIIQKKQDWIKQQQELKKQQQEEEEKQQQELWEKEKEKYKKNSAAEINVEEFVNQQISWLEKRNDHILTEQIKKDKTLTSSLTFRPQIQKRIGDKRPSEKVEIRLLDYQQKKQENLLKLEDKYLPSFKPNLTQKSLLSMDWASKSFCNTSYNNLWS